MARGSTITLEDKIAALDKTIAYHQAGIDAAKEKKNKLLHEKDSTKLINFMIEKGLTAEEIMKKFATTK